jgi:peptidoglycan/LPS O-acetylase OafA/YrhL
VVFEEQFYVVWPPLLMFLWRRVRREAPLAWMVAGAAALVKAVHPDWSPGEVRKAILAAATPGPVPGDPDSYAEPVLNVVGF